MTEQTAVPAVRAGLDGPPPATVSPRAWQALVVLLAGMFIALLDTTIVNVALPTIRTSLDASESTLSWIISGYALAFGLALIPAGRVGDRIGHKWVFFTGIALFTVASLACGLAQNDLQLVVARVVQGLAGGIFVPAVTAFIQLLFPGRVARQGVRHHGRRHRRLVGARPDRRRPDHPGVRRRRTAGAWSSGSTCPIGVVDPGRRGPPAAASATRRARAPAPGSTGRARCCSRPASSPCSCR